MLTRTFSTRKGCKGCNIKQSYYDKLLKEHEALKVKYNKDSLKNKDYIVPFLLGGTIVTAAVCYELNGWLP